MHDESLGPTIFTDFAGGPHFDQALCAQVGGEFWFPEKGQNDVIRHAKALCRDCPEQVPCLDWALEHNEAFGVWGGLSERERRRLKRVMQPNPTTQKDAS